MPGSRGGCHVMLAFLLCVLLRIYDFWGRGGGKMGDCTVRLGRAFKAVCGISCLLRLILPPEMDQAPRRRDSRGKMGDPPHPYARARRLALLIIYAPAPLTIMSIAEQPHQYIHIMAAFRQQTRRRRPLLSPVPADIRVRKMPVSDGLRPVDVDDIAQDLVFAEQLFDGEDER